MGTVTSIARARFSVGEVIRHRRFGYRGVIVDVDPTFQLTDEWYEAVARSRPPKNKPWYHVLVDEAAYSTYVAERHLELESDAAPVRHPMLERFFSGFDGERYVNDEHGH